MRIGERKKWTRKDCERKEEWVRWNSERVGKKVEIGDIERKERKKKGKWGKIKVHEWNIPWKGESKKMKVSMRRNITDGVDGAQVLEKGL